MSSSTSPHHGGGAALSILPSDILHAHILTRLDGAALSSTAAASSQLRLLSTEHKLWRDICVAAWPSTQDPKLRQLISAFASGHRSFFSDAFPLLDSWASPPAPHRPCSSPSSELISAVDIHYMDNLLFSKVHSIETDSSWFLSSPFRVDVLDPKDLIPSPLRRAADDENWLRHLEENLTVSWIVIDPMKKRAANISSRKPVKVQRHWLSGDIQLHYTTIVAGDSRAGSSSEFVQCGVVVNCGKKEEEGAEMFVTEVSLRMLDMEGKHLNGRESVGVLEEAIEKGKRIKGNGEEMKWRYEKFTEMTKKRTMRKEKMENALDLVCTITGITVFLGFLCFILFR